MGHSSITTKMPTSTHNHLQHWWCLPHVNIGMLGWANTPGPSIWELSATAGYASGHSACSPSLHVSHRMFQRRRAASSVCKHIQHSSHSIYVKAQWLKEAALFQRSIKNAQGSSKRSFWCMWLVMPWPCWACLPHLCRVETLLWLQPGLFLKWTGSTFKMATKSDNTEGDKAAPQS